MLQGKLPVKALVCGAACSTALVAMEATAETSAGTDALYVDDYVSSAWTSGEFVGTMFRDLEADRLQVSVDHRVGGFDAGFGPTYALDAVDGVSEDYVFDARFTITGEGEGEWYVGPKISVNWPSGSGDGAAGWYENYIVDRASRTPEEMDAWLLDDYDDGNPENRYIGTTTHDGSTYKHYVFFHRSWTQYWAVRQSYRDGGPTTVKPILNKWRADGMDDLRLDGIKYNVETAGDNRRELTFTRTCFPASFADGSCRSGDSPAQPAPSAEADPASAPTGGGGSDGTAVDELAGNRRVEGGRNGRYLHAGGTDDWAIAQVLDLDEDWPSQKWVFERVAGNVYRIRNVWTGRYLSAPSTNEADVIRTATLDEAGWTSQMWAVEKAGDGYRIGNEWSKLYLSEAAENGGELTQEPLVDDRPSQRWNLPTH